MRWRWQGVFWRINTFGPAPLLNSGTELGKESINRQEHAGEKVGATEFLLASCAEEIDEEEYMKTLEKLMEEKMSELQSETNVLAKKKKATDFLLQKGYERDIIYALVKE